MNTSRTIKERRISKTGTTSVWGWVLGAFVVLAFLIVVLISAGPFEGSEVQGDPSATMSTNEPVASEAE